MGGCGDYFDVADLVIMMKEFVPLNATKEAQKVAAIHDTGRLTEANPDSNWNMDRRPLPASFNSSLGKKRVKIESKSLDWIQFGSERIDIRGLDQLVDICQARAVGMAIHLAASRFFNGKVPLKEALEKLEKYLDDNGLDLLDPYHRGEGHPGSFARPRPFEIAAAVNRLRTVRFR
jgi:predicted ABC-class ATPase